MIINWVVKIIVYGKSKFKWVKVSIINKIKVNVKIKIIGFNLGYGEIFLYLIWDYGIDSSDYLLEFFKIVG